MVDLITTVNPLLTAHFAAINGDPNGLGNNFEAAATHLVLADPVEKDKVRCVKRSGAQFISSAIAERGRTGVDLRWYKRDEFKLLDQSQKDELISWRTSAEGKAVIEANKTKLKAERNTKKQNQGGGEGNTSGEDNTAAEKAKADKVAKKTQNNYQAAVAKAAKQLVASSIEAERAECAAANLSLGSRN